MLMFLAHYNLKKNVKNVRNVFITTQQKCH